MKALSVGIADEVSLRGRSNEIFLNEENNMLENNKSEHRAIYQSSATAKVRDGILFFGVGAAIGAALALLFAPKSGSELRGDIADVSRKGYDATVETARDLKDQSYEAVKIVKEKANAVLDLASAKLAIGGDAVNGVVAATTGAVKAGIERMENEGGSPLTKGPGGQRT